MRSPIGPLVDPVNYDSALVTPPPRYVYIVSEEGSRPTVLKFGDWHSKGFLERIFRRNRDNVRIHQLYTGKVEHELTFSLGSRIENSGYSADVRLSYQVNDPLTALDEGSLLYGYLRPEVVDKTRGIVNDVQDALGVNPLIKLSPNDQKDISRTLEEEIRDYLSTVGIRLYSAGFTLIPNIDEVTKFQVSRAESMEPFAERYRRVLHRQRSDQAALDHETILQQDQYDIERNVLKRDGQLDDESIRNQHRRREEGLDLAARISSEQEIQRFRLEVSRQERELISYYIHEGDKSNSDLLKMLSESRSPIKSVLILKLMKSKQDLLTGQGDSSDDERFDNMIEMLFNVEADRRRIPRDVALAEANRNYGLVDSLGKLIGIWKHGSN